MVWEIEWDIESNENMKQVECVSCLVPVCMMQIGMYAAILCRRYFANVRVVGGYDA